MNNAVFIDTGPLIAFADTRDQFHTQAIQWAPQVEKMSPNVTSPFVLAEACAFLQRRMSATASRQLWHRILSGEAGVDLLSVELADIERAYQIDEHYQDQNFGFVDCTSFALMERLKITRAFTFDQHYLIFQLPTGPIQRFPA